MAIAGDIKSIFEYIFRNNLVTSDLVQKLLDKNYCAESFSSGKYPILLRCDTTKPHQEQRKFGTHQARYYDPENFLIRFNDEEFFFTSQLFEEQRKHFYSWLKSTFNLNPEEIISNKKSSLIDEFENFVDSGSKKELLQQGDFYFEKAQELFLTFKKFGEGEKKSFFEGVLKRFLESDMTFKVYLPSLKKSSKDYELLELLGKVVAHFDMNACNKNIWNETPDKRVLARAFVRQTDWVKTLLLYKIQSNELAEIKDGSIKNTIHYIENPSDGLTMLSDKHRKQFSLNVLGKEYDPKSFVEHLKDYFSSVNLTFKNEDNRTAFICFFLYSKDIKPYWLNDTEDKSYWVLGAYWSGEDEDEKDQTKSFLDQGMWLNGFSEDSEDPSLEIVKKIKEGDIIAIKSSFTVKNEKGERISCLRIKAIGEVLENEEDGVRLKVNWIEKEPFDIPGLSYRKTAEPVRDSDVDIIFKRSRSEGQNMKEVKPKGPLNVIYYGPPGTGKTFKLTHEIANKFTDGNLTSESAFITDTFSEMPWWRVFACVLIDLGRPVTVTEIQAHQFTQAKTKASESNTVRQTIWGTLQSRAILESKTVNVKERRGPYLFDKNEKSEWHLAGNWKEELIEEIELVKSVRSSKQVSPSTKRYELVTFHPSYSYEDFVEGIKPVLDDEGDSKLQYALVNGIFKKMCLRASEDPNNDYAIFIDEINRGNIPAIFGELITLIEDDKREALSTILPYSKKPFTVPKNLYIYGTMNTADKSVEALDLALRRRFVFEEHEPSTKEINCKFNPELVKKIHETLNHRVEALLGKDYRIGHSYFMNDSVDTLDSLKSVFENKIIPLLKEYFYEDWDKMCMVLGKKFVVKVNGGRVKFARSYEDSEGEFETKNIYRISDPKEWTLETFKSIYED